MAEFIVTNTNDSGAGSLRDALAQAEANGVGADEIVFNLAAGSEINLQSSLVINSGTVTINGDLDGDGDPDIIISGDSNDNGFGDAGDVAIVLEIATGATATLNSMQVSDGYHVGADGADGDVSSSTGGDGTVAAAGIAINLGANLTINNSIIDGHEAIGGNGGDGLFGEGGAGGDAAAGIANLGTLTIADSVIDNNDADGGNGGNGDQYESYTGGVYQGSDGGNGGSAATGIVNLGTLNITNTGINGTSDGGNGGNGGSWYGYGSASNGGDGGNGGNSINGIYEVGSGVTTGNFVMPSGNLASPGGGGALGPGYYGGSNGSAGSSGTALNGFSGTSTPTFNGFVGTTSGDDVITGTDYVSDTFFGLTGDDIIDGGAAISGYVGDTIFGGAGNDQLTAGYDATVFGGAGNDTLTSTYVVNGTWDGGTGIDTFVNAETGYDFSFNMVTGDASGSVNIVNVENVDGVDDASSTDSIIGSSLANIINGRAGDDTIEGGLGDDTLDGGTEEDTLSFANFVASSGDDGVTVSLAITTAQDTGAGLDTITNFENILGSDHNDTLTGNSGANFIYGGAGDDRIGGDTTTGSDDTLDGGIGTDTAVFRFFYGSYDFEASTALSFVVSDTIISGLSDGTDTLSNFEFVEFGGGTFSVVYGTDSATPDSVVGTSADNILVAGDGDDFLNASNGTDILLAGNGNDELVGGAGSDVINGGSNTAIGSQGAEGVGDMASYSSSNAAVTVNLGNGIATGGHAEGDELISIENLFGSIHGDTLTGDDTNNFINGFNGADTLEGGLGNDYLSGGQGNDTIMGDDGNDFLNGGTGNDTADYSNSGAAVTVQINNGGTVDGGFATGDTVWTENIIGSDFADDINGNSLANGLYGGDSDDTFNAASGNDSIFGGEGDDFILGSRGGDTINGGAHSGSGDTASYSNSDARVVVDLDAGTATGSGHGSGDTLIDIENVFGSLFNDDIYGDDGANVLSGFNGVDELFGGSGDDSLVGGSGLDYLDGGTDNDVLTGGGGFDRFLFSDANFGQDTITDFTNNQELMDMRGSGLVYSDLTITQVAGDTVVSVNGTSNTITLVNITTVIDENDFIF